MEVVTANKENPENKGIQIIDLATKKHMMTDIFYGIQKRKFMRRKRLVKF